MSENDPVRCPSGPGSRERGQQAVPALRASIPSAGWKRYRFRCFNEDDPRPVKFPPPGPYWISGYGEGFAVLVAYLPADCEDGLEDYWPIDDDPLKESHNWWEGYSCQEVPEIVFTDRFPKPEWWTP